MSISTCGPTLPNPFSLVGCLGCASFLGSSMQYRYICRLSAIASQPFSDRLMNSVKTRPHEPVLAVWASEVSLSLSLSLSMARHHAVCSHAPAKQPSTPLINRMTSSSKCCVSRQVGCTSRGLSFVPGHKGRKIGLLSSKCAPNEGETHNPEDKMIDHPVGTPSPSELYKKSSTGLRRTHAGTTSWLLCRSALRCSKLLSHTGWIFLRLPAMRFPQWKHPQEPTQDLEALHIDHACSA